MANVINVSTLFSARTLASLETQCPLYATAGNFLQENFIAGRDIPPHGLTIRYKETEYADGTPNGRAVTEGDKVSLSGRFQEVTVSEADIKNHLIRVTITQRDYEMRRGVRSLTDLAQSRLIDSYGDPAASVMQAKTEKSAYDAIKTAALYSAVDDPDKLTVFNSERDVFNLRKVANMLSLPITNQRVYLPDEVNVNLAQTLLSRFNEVQNTKLTKSGAVIGNLAGMNFYETSGSTYVRHTPGDQFSQDPEFTVTSVSADGLEITFGGLGANLAKAFRAGDLIAIPSVKLFNRQSKVVLPTSYVATVTADVASSGGSATIRVNYPLIASGTHRTINALPAANAAAKMFPEHDKVVLAAGNGFEKIEVPLGDVDGVENSLAMYGSGKGKKALPIKSTFDGVQLSRESQVLMGSWTHFHSYAPHCIVMPSAIG